MPSFLNGRWSFKAKSASADDQSSNEESTPSDSRQSSQPQSRLDQRYSVGGIDEIAKYQAVVRYLHARLVACQWLPLTADPTHLYSGVFLRRSRGVYISEPEEVHPMLLAAVQKINATVAFTMATETTNIIMSLLQPGHTELHLPNGFQVQVVDSMSDIVSSPSGFVKKFQYAALIREERLMLVWHDNMDYILDHAAKMEGRLLSLIWGSPAPMLSSHTTPTFTPKESAVTSPTASVLDFPREATKETSDPDVDVAAVEEIADEEAATSKESLERPVALTSSIFVGLASMLLVVLFLGFGVSNLVYESVVDGDKIRYALLVTLPIFMIFSVFFAIVIFGDLFQAFGPVKTLKVNTRFYSPIRPDMKRAYAQGFTPPRVTIQMPVYTESLDGVIIPTITSLKLAMSHYESHGGTANIFINDDGFAYLSEDQQQERINFYHDNNIGWVARPKNNDDGYVRKGKFKKASNMNFALNVSNKIERELIAKLAGTLEKSDMVDPVEEEAVYQQALGEVCQADPHIKGAGGDIRVGEIILIVDSDTRVPPDCLLSGAAEMYLSPEVAIVQHSTAVLQVAHDYFEDAITFFTNLIYTAIRFSVGNGEVAPFVGHNAFLRWQAVQSVGRPDDGYVAYWSESHVSEDFDLALRLQIAGNIVRLASYHNDEFKEGVSLTIYDELSRWQKYAYGCNELIFNPIHTWVYRGPLTKLFKTFMWSNMQMSSKITIFGYITSYYALAAGLPLTVINYFAVGWFNGYLDKYYLESWKVFLSVLVVFTGLGNICLALIRYRMSEKSLFSSLLENFKWMPMFTIFFGGLSFHLSMALLAHMFRINMTWSTTAKEKDESNFFKEMPKIFRTFKWMYLVVLPLFPGLIYLGYYAPRGWTITETAAIVPMAVTLICHAVLPLVLNPSLMVFNY